MKTILNILTLGLYSLLSKKRQLRQTVEKVKYRTDGTIKKEVTRETEYSEEAGSENLPK